PFHTSHASGGFDGSTPRPSASASTVKRSAIPAADDSRPNSTASPGISRPSRIGEVKHTTAEPGKRRSSVTSVIRSPLASVVAAALNSGCAIVRSFTVVNTTGASPASALVATCMPAGTVTSSGCTADSQNVTGVIATDGGNGSMPSRFKKCVNSLSGTWLSRYSTVSLIHANSSISATPGSDRLWLVHSGVYRGMSRFASSTRSWNVRSSRFGTGSGMSDLLVRDHVERVHQIAAVVGGLDPVGDVDRDQRRVVRIRRRAHVLHLDARLPLRQRLPHALRHQAQQVRRHRLEQQIPDLAAELGPHH